MNIPLTPDSTIPEPEKGVTVTVTSSDGTPIQTRHFERPNISTIKTLVGLTMMGPVSFRITGWHVNENPRVLTVMLQG